MMHTLLPLVLFFLAGCSGQKTIVRDADKEQVLTINNDNVYQPYDLAPSRFELIRDTALMYSAQCSLRHYYKIINQALIKHEYTLNKTYNFQPLMLEHDIIPPVVVHADRTIEQISSAHLVVADKSFKILKHGAFTTIPLTWKTYLLEKIYEPDLPDKGSLPSDNTEKEVWSKYAEQGWEAGKEQAFMMFKNNLEHLNQDYLGMITFHRLFQQGLMTAPIINAIENGITTAPDVMNINQRILAIAEQGFLEGDHQRWHSYIFFTE